MAKVRDQHLGTIQGAVGPQVFKVLRGNSYVAQLPHMSGIAPTQKAIIARSRFGITGKFASAVNKIVAFKKLWDIYTPNNISPYNGIFRENYPYITETDVTELASITPMLTGFNVTTTEVSVDAGGVNVSIDPIGTNSEIDTMIEKYIQLGAVIKCTDPVVPNTPSVNFISLKSDNVSLNLINPLTFSISLSEQQKNLFAAYDTHVTFLGFVTITADVASVHNSTGFTA